MGGQLVSPLSTIVAFTSIYVLFMVALSYDTFLFGSFLCNAVALRLGLGLKTDLKIYCAKTV
ncbi:hypothetical protein C2G38_2164846 [Gigaspora rosea]|uniref:Uncharacterized protein n=1 Tax=Gigaspora rosea TaxID=44941 RepID=A0A397VY09_9GLOM|nr:hypothetical protein C2G38_2164846 [Gigaspora rosea]